MEWHETPEVNPVEQAEKPSSSKLGLITETLGGKMCLGMEKAEAYGDELNRLAKLPIPELEKEARKVRVEKYYEGRNQEIVIRRRLGLKIPEYLMAEQLEAVNEGGEAMEQSSNPKVKISPEIRKQVEKENKAIRERTLKYGHALKAFCSVLPPDVDGMEVLIGSDGSGSIDATVGKRRVVGLTFQIGEPDGAVYNYRKPMLAGRDVYQYWMKEGSQMAEAVETPVDKAIAKAEAVLREALAKKEPLIEQWKKLVDIANEAPMPYDTLIRRLGTTMVLFLAEDEKRIPDFASRFSRCVLHLAPKAGKPGGVRNPFAACRAHLRKLVGLKPLTKREYGLAVSQTMEATSKTPF